MKIALVAPHIFMQEAILPDVIFSPGQLCISLANQLTEMGNDVILYSPGKITTKAKNITADLKPFETELKLRGYGYLELLKKHPLTFISLARQVQSELIAKAYSDANNDLVDVVHVYMNEEDIALQFADFCTKPVVFTHHDPFNFSTKYRTVMPKYKYLNWLSISLSQRSEMPADTNWVGNVYHGLAEELYTPAEDPTNDYILYLGRIIEAKGVHLAIEAVQEYNRSQPDNPLKLIIAGKHYSGTKDDYWNQQILPSIDNKQIIFSGYHKDAAEKGKLLSNAAGLIIPSLFEEPFGMVTIEALAAGTPVIGLATGATPEILEDGVSGILVDPVFTGEKIDNSKTAHKLANGLTKLKKISRKDCRSAYEKCFTAQHMAEEHLKVYESLKNN